MGTRIGILFLLLAGGAAGAAPKIEDKAKLFSPEAVRRAEAAVQAIRDDFGVDVVVQTFEKLPDADKHNWRVLTKRQRAEIYVHAAETYADTHDMRGLYVMVTMEPEKVVTVRGWPADFNAEQYGSKVKRSSIENILRKGLWNDRDAALSSALTDYRVRLENSRLRPESPLWLTSALIVVASGLGLWAVLCVVRRRTTPVSPPEPLYPPAALGGLLGVPSSFIVNDRLYADELVSPPSGVIPVAVAPEIFPAESAPPDSESGGDGR